MPRRPNGEGSIRKRKDGRWEGRFFVGHDPVTGKAQYKSVCARTQKEVSIKLKEAIASAGKQNVFSKLSDVTVGEWLQEWYKIYSLPGLRPTTAEHYLMLINHYISPRIGDIKLKDLKTIDIQRMINDLKENGRIKYRDKLGNGLSAKTVRTTYMVLHAALEQAVFDQLIVSNPCVGCKLPKKEKIEMKTLPEDKIEDYFNAALMREVLPMFYLELTTGLRRGELLALLWEDVDVEKHTINVTKSVLRINGELLVTEPKTSNGIRKVYVPESTIKWLIFEHEQHPNSKYLFPSPKDENSMRDPHSVTAIHRKILEDIGADPDIRFHDLRHTFATIALQNGVNVKAVSQTLGHYSAAFTLDTYTHATEKLKEDAALQIGEVMEGIWS